MRLLPIAATAGAVILTAAVGTAFWFLPEAVLPARYLATDCRRVPITTPDGPLAGAEDIALSADGRLLYISAYDRLAVETAVELGEPPPEGGLYVVRVNHLDRIGDVSAELAIEAMRIPRGLRPHGIDVSGDRIAVVNRGFSRTGEPGTDILLLTAEGRDGTLTLDRRIENTGFCAANDLVLAGRRIFVTLDRGTCPGWSYDERFGIASRGRVLDVALPGEGGVRLMLEGLSFPNGIEVLEGAAGGTVVAETRGRRLLRADAGRWVGIPLPGGPDNLSIDAEGMVIAAVHPNLTKLGLYRYGWTDSAASRIVRVDPATGAVEVLFDDPAGELYSAASSALFAGQLLVAGSVRDEGLLICRYALG